MKRLFLLTAALTTLLSTANWIRSYDSVVCAENDAVCGSPISRLEACEDLRDLRETLPFQADDASDNVRMEHILYSSEEGSGQILKNGVERSGLPNHLTPQRVHGGIMP